MDSEKSRNAALDVMKGLAILAVLWGHVVFMNLKQARNIIEDWRKDYNEVRPHSSLKNMTPMEYATEHGGRSR